MSEPRADGAGSSGERSALHGALHTRACDLFGIRVPVVQTGMGWVSGARLTAATARAGGLGILASATMTLEELAAAIAKVDQRDRTVVLTSHDLTLGLDIADRVVILAKGQVAFDAPRAGLDRASLEAAYAAAINV